MYRKKHVMLSATSREPIGLLRPLDLRQALVEVVLHVLAAAPEAEKIYNCVYKYIHMLYIYIYMLHTNIVVYIYIYTYM